MVEETDLEKKVAAQDRRIKRLEDTVQQLVRAAQQSAKAVSYLQAVTPKQVIRR